MAADFLGVPVPQTPDERKLGHVLRFLRLVWAVDNGLQSTSKRMERKVGVTGPQRLALRLLGQYGRLSPGELAQLMHLHPSTVTGIVQRLEAHGYVVRQVNEQDQRRADLVLTETGAKVNEVRTGTVESAVHRALERLPDEQVAAAAQVLTALAEELAPPRESPENPPSEGAAESPRRRRGRSTPPAPSR